MTDVVPPLRHGLIDDRTGGVRFPQFALRDEAGELRALDDLLGGRFAIVRQAPSEAFPPELGAAWDRLDGRRIAVAGDVDGRFGAWLDSAGAIAAVLRPDRYVYGLARDDGELEDLVRRLIDQLGAPSAMDRPALNALERSRP
jgi:3-(3-hydroxy-phenyl)propionate hydroxylase